MLLHVITLQIRVLENDREGGDFVEGNYPNLEVTVHMCTVGQHESMKYRPLSFQLCV